MCSIALSVPVSLIRENLNCSRYLKPPWINLVDLLLVPEAKSDISTKHTLNPLDAASKHIPAPVIPPPITITSKVLEEISLINSFLLFDENKFNFLANLKFF